MPVIPIYPETKALIFDIDGTLVDTMATHYKACQIVCNEHGFDFPLDYFYAKAGIPTIKVFKMLIEELNLDLDGEKLGHLKEEKYLELIHEVKPLGPVYEVAKTYYGKLPMALGTGGTKEIAHKTLAAAGIEGMFDIIITCEDVLHPKPAPDTFLAGAQKMGISPANCQVFEDADMGIAAAKAAGMLWTDIRQYV
ncbi:MAG TPA: HAD-IA family hydrolase [Cytophagaceae bacterium]